jgi:hypothetical protein
LAFPVGWASRTDMNLQLMNPQERLKMVRSVFIQNDTEDRLIRVKE